jgi:cell division septum initiation protein DivIVA
MTEHGILEDDLRPAFLFLSGCETDLARQARAAESIPEVAEHCTNARMWLQKVYGSGTTPAAFEAMVNGVASSLSPITNRGAGVKIDENLSQRRILERENQMLRDRQYEQTNILSEMRVAKRKLQDDIDCERDLRYRIQRRLDDTRSELEMARKMETYALDQVKREVEARRKAEDTMRAETSKRLELQRILDEPPARPHTKCDNTAISETE